MTSPPAYRPVSRAFERWPPDVQAARAREFHERMRSRRTVRHYAPDPLPDDVIDRAIAPAASARVIVVFRVDHGVEILPGGTERHIKHHYYVDESVGYAAPNAVVPDITRKDMAEVRIA